MRERSGAEAVGLQQREVIGDMNRGGIAARNRGELVDEGVR